MVKDRIVQADGTAPTPSDPATTPAKKTRAKKSEDGTPKTPTKKAAGTNNKAKATPKKRKVEEVVEDENSDEAEGEVKPKTKAEVNGDD